MNLRRLLELTTYGAVAALCVVALGLFGLLPRLSLVTALVYQGF